MKSHLPVCTALSKYALPCISSIVFGIVLLALAPTQAIGQCAGYQIDVPGHCTCNDPSGRTPVTILVKGASGDNWTIKNVNGLYDLMSPPPPAPPALLAAATPLTPSGLMLDSFFLHALRLNTTGYWIQVTNGTCDLDIMVGNPDPCAVPDVCDGVDNDCDGQIDEEAPVWYADTDGDGYGDPNTSTQDCDQPMGYVADNTDCDDDKAAANPGATEICDNGIDDDCDGNVDGDDDDCGCPEIAGLLLVTLPDGSCLYVHPTDNSTSIQWGGFGTDIPTLANKTTTAQANADFDGEVNTQKIVDELGAGTYAAKLCADLVSNGYDDWYLPAAGELNAMYQQLGPAGNNGFVNLSYWSSSEYSNGIAWIQYFDNGLQYLNDKFFFINRCRCVRR